jgi:hypothetical protein
MNTYQYLRNKRRAKKAQVKQSLSTNQPAPAPAGASIVTMAVVLDGVVQEVLRAEDRLAALLLSKPDFIEVHDDLRPEIGEHYENGIFQPAPTEPEETPAP